MNLKPIIWKDAGYSFEHGYVDKLHLFTVGWDGLGPKDDDDAYQYILTSQLPGIQRRRIESAAKGKALAYILLRGWIASLEDESNENI